MWRIFTIYTILIYSLFPSYWTFYASAEDQNINNHHVGPNLKYIYTLEDHCVKQVTQVCRNFQYENASEVVFFELKMEVHITDASTYDLSSAQKAYETMTFENSTFTHFPLHLFFTLDIKELDMRNCGITFITWENFLRANELKVLLLSHNKVESITEMTFMHAANLQYLFLKNNQLRYLVNESFRGLRKLRLLDLSNNRLRDLPADIFAYLTDLQELKLDDNRLFSIGNELLIQNEHLILLTLKNNRLHELGDDAFRWQTRLKLLDISNNRPLYTLVLNVQVAQLVAANCSLNRVNIYGDVKNVDLRDNKILELYFSQPETLETLDLRNNALQQLASLTRATSLKTLIISDNPDLKTLPEPWLGTQLDNLILTNTSLKVLPILSLANQQHLKVLEVSSNMLREIDPKHFIYLENLRHFYIHNNDWNCYNLQLIMEVLIRPHSIAYKRDLYDADFPGEYIDGIACMYRLEPINKSNELNEMEMDEEQKSENLQTLEEKNDIILDEVSKLRNELGVIVDIYEKKFKQAFDMIQNLRLQLARFEELNSTFWQHVTITV